MPARNKRVNEMIAKDFERAVGLGVVELKKSIEERVEDALVGMVNEAINIDLLRSELIMRCSENTVIKPIELTLESIETLFEKYYITNNTEYFYDKDIYHNNWIDYWNENPFFSYKTLIEVAVGAMMDMIIKSRDSAGRTYMFIDKATKSHETDEISIYFYGRDLADTKDLSFHFCRRNENVDTSQEIAYIQTYIGQACASGRLGIDEIDNAMNWYQRATNNGGQEAAAELKNDNADGKVVLAMHYLTGDGVGQDIDKATKILEELAGKGNVKALSALGREYFTGQYCEKDISKALVYLNKAVELDDDNALMLLGWMYMQGDEVEQNKEKGFSYVKRAAEKGNKRAILICGMAYIVGNGVEQDIEKGSRYLTMVVMMGDELAMQVLSDISKIEVD